MRSLAEGKIKWTLLVVPPKDPAKPTASELNAGIDASGSILRSDFNWSNGDSATFAEPSLVDKGDVSSLGSSSYNLGVTVFREWDGADGAADITEDVVFQTLKAKGTVLHAYARETSKDSGLPWAAGDEIFLGGKIMTDAAQRVSDEGTIKRRVPLTSQGMFENIAVAAGTGA